MDINQLIKKVKEYNKNKEQIQLIKKAYKFAEEQHKEQKRVSGEPYIKHPLEVAYILADLQLDYESIVAALLHDVVEDTETTNEEIKKLFGEEVSHLIDGVTKITKLKEKSHFENQAENIRKFIMASSKDIRIIFIKLADRLHNMRTLNVFNEDKQKRIAKESMLVYAPLAYRLGLASLKWELEDLAFSYLEPARYTEIKEKLAMSYEQREKEVNHYIEEIKKLLKENKLKGEIKGRPKSIYSIYRKMKKKKKRFEEIYDLTALRIIVKSVQDCYAMMGIIHQRWTPITKEFNDYIANPKQNMYQSLHIAVIGDEEHPVEIQIRTEEMDRIAEEGIAAHWRYKGVKGDADFDNKLSWLKQILEWQKETPDAKEFMDMLQVDIYEDQIFAFTPKGKVVQLTKDSTVVDFAYAIHTDIGSKCIAGKINDVFVPLRTKINNGDRVEILTSKSQTPSREWLKFVRTSKAKTKVKQYIMQTQNIPVKALPKQVVEKKELAEWIIDVEGIPNPKIKLAKCCKPLPGDKIIGFCSKNDLVSIHKDNCKLLAKLEAGSRKKKVNVNWMSNIGSIVEVRVDALNRIGIFAEILNTLISVKAQINSAHSNSISKNMVVCSFIMETESLEHLQDLIERIYNIQDVKKVYIGDFLR